MRLNLIWSGALLLSLLTTGYSQADIVIDFTNEPGGTGELLDAIQADGANLHFEDLPFTVAVPEDTTGVLELTLLGGSSLDNDDSSTRINASSNSFGPNSDTPAGGTENASRFDVDAEEQLFISFNRDVFIENIGLNSLTGDEQFTFGTVTGIDSSAFDFTSAGATPGLFVPANQSILLEATGPAGTSVGLVSLDVAIATVPEPSSLLGLMGLAGLIAVKRRRA